MAVEKVLNQGTAFSWSEPKECENNKEKTEELGKEAVNLTPKVANTMSVTATAFDSVATTATASLNIKDCTVNVYTGKQ